MDAYTSFAQVYDLFMDNVPYDEWALYLRKILTEYGIDSGILLDLGCGTGKLTRRMAAFGYDMIGVDNSFEMLDIAREEGNSSILYLLQDMREFELYGTVRAVYSACDCLNYILEEEELLRVFKLVNNYLDPKGLFIFDVNTPEKLQAMDGQVFLDEDEDVYCVWRGAFDPERNICSYGMDLFQRQGKLWHRSFEEHQEYAYSKQQLTEYLKAAGFTGIRVYGDRSFSPPEQGAQRIYFSARKGKRK